MTNLFHNSSARAWFLRSNSVHTFGLFFSPRAKTPAPFRAPPCAVLTVYLLAFPAWPMCLWHRVIGPHLRQSATTPRENGNALRAAKVSRDALTTTSRPSSSLGRLLLFLFFFFLLLLSQSLLNNCIYDVRIEVYTRCTRWRDEMHTVSKRSACCLSPFIWSFLPCLLPCTWKEWFCLNIKKFK